MSRQSVEEKLNSIVEKGKTDTARVLREIMNEFLIRKDFVARPAGINYFVDSSGVRVGLRDERNGGAYGLTGHARGQLLSKLNVPDKFADRLIALGEHELLTENLTRLTERLSGDGMLFRAVGNTVKGVLSPSYRRMDASPIFDTFATQSLKAGYVPMRGVNTDTRYVLTFILPEVFEPIPGEFCVVGVQLRTSDYGFGAMQFNIVILRVYCVNMATGIDIMRKVHIGKRFEMPEDGDNVIELSERTYALDTDTVSSAITDAVSQSTKYLEPLQKSIASACEHEPDFDKIFKELKKKGARNDLLEKVQLIYDTPLPVEMLPQGNSVWRLSNVLSFLANSEEGDNKLMLEDAAFSMVAGGKELVAA